MVEKPRYKPEMSVPEFKNSLDSIVSKDEGNKRKEIIEKFDLIDNKFILKDKFTEKPKAPLGIVSKDPADDPNEFLTWLSTSSGFIEGLTSTITSEGPKPTILYDLQRLLIDLPPKHQFVWLDKSRQIGFSFLIACRGLAKSMICRKSTSIAVSFNEEESKEKIIYARELWDSMPTKFKLQRRLKYDNKTSLVFEKSGADSSETRILSFPQRMIRGKGGGVDVYLDEFAHCIHARKIYTSALPVLSRGDSSLWIGSTPAGKGNLFYEIGINMEEHYNSYLRLHIHWWDVPEFCIDVKRARKEALHMITDDRIKAFATDRITLIRNSMPLEDFQQEYECEYLDEVYSYFPWDLINACVPIFNSEKIHDVDTEAEHLGDYDKSKEGSGIDFFCNHDGRDEWINTFEEFMKYVYSGIFKPPFYLGFDVGRSDKNLSEIIIIEEDEKNHHQLIRLNLTLRNMRLPEQRAVAKKIIETMGDKLHKAGIDPNGIGQNIAEDLEHISYDLLVKLPFNQNSWKEEAVKRLKYRMELTERKSIGISFPAYRSLLRQIHSIKRKLLPSEQWRFSADEGEKHHGDKFWAIVAASEMGHPITDLENAVVNLDKRLLTQKAPDKIQRFLPTVALPTMDSAIRFDPYQGMSGMCGSIGRIKPPSYSNMPSVLVGESNDTLPYHDL